jgi:hypothetical protein
MSTDNAQPQTIVEQRVRAHRLWMESVLEAALVDGFRGWVEIDCPFLGDGSIVRDVWRHDVMPTRATRQRGIFFNMATMLPRAKA